MKEAEGGGGRANGRTGEKRRKEKEKGKDGDQFESSFSCIACHKTGGLLKAINESESLVH